MTGFVGTKTKALIRREWNLPVLRNWSEKLDESLSYFGLTGPHLEDVLSWRDHLQDITGVERLRSGKNRAKDLAIIEELLTNVTLYEIERFQLLRGEIESIILEGQDIDSNRPKMSTDGHRYMISFQYDLVNLDFCAGIRRKTSTTESKTIRSIRKLIERQRGTDFLLLLTLNVRADFDEEITRYLSGAAREASSYQLEKQSNILAWYTDLGEGMKKHKLKALVPLFIRHEAERWGFDCNSYPPLTYVGGGNARLVHFMFELIHTNSILHTFSQQSEADVIDLPLVEANDQQVIILHQQHEPYDFQRCEELLKHLPDQIRLPLIESLPG